MTTEKNAKQTIWDLAAETHAIIAQDYPQTAYIEICSQRHSGFNAHLCSELVDNNPDRIKFSMGGGYCARSSLSDMLKTYYKKHKDCKAPASIKIRDPRLDKLSELEQVLRDDICWHYMQFYIFATPVDGWCLKIFDYYEGHRLSQLMLDISAKDHNEFLDLAVQEIEKLIEKVSNQ